MPGVERLSVLLVSWNGRQHLEHCLPALLGQRAPAGVGVEVLVLDNGSGDGSASWLAERFPLVRCVESATNIGFAAGNNRLAQLASGDVLLLLNNDTLPETDLVAEYVAGWRAAADDVAALAGRLVDWPAERLDFGRGIATFDGHAFALDQGRPLAGARCPRPGEELLFGCGGNLLISRQSFLAAGGFDPRYFAYFEDVDLGWRLWARGERVLAWPAATARHRQGATGARLGDARRGALYERNALLTVAKNFEDGVRERMLAAVLLTYLARIEAMIATANPGGEALRAEHGLGADAASGWRPRLARLLQRLAARVGRQPAPATVGTPRLTDAQTLAQLRGLAGFLALFEELGPARARLAAARRRGDREIFERFPLWIVPTYPGDAELFATAEFAAWLPAELRFERARLDQVLGPAPAAP